MKEAQIIVKMDGNGRIALPEELRRKMNAPIGTRFELYYDEQKAEIALQKYNPYKDILVYLMKAICDIGLLYGDTDVANKDERKEISGAIKDLTRIHNRMKAIILKRPSQNLCKPPMWCRIEVSHWRFL